MKYSSISGVVRSRCSEWTTRRITVASVPGVLLDILLYCSRDVGNLESELRQLSLVVFVDFAKLKGESDPYLAGARWPFNILVVVAYF